MATLGSYSYVGLACIVASGLLIWLGMAMTARPFTFSFAAIERIQWAALGISVIMSLLWWGRLIMIYSNERIADHG